MEFVKVTTSSNVSAIGYDMESSTLQVIFHNGSAYNYQNVPYNVFEDFVNSSSKGQFVHAYLKNRYSNIRVR